MRNIEVENMKPALAEVLIYACGKYFPHVSF